MRILLTGVTGYIGKRLLPVLLEKGHKIIACTRSIKRFEILPSWKDRIETVEIDFLDEPNYDLIPKDIDAAYFLIHSMSASIGDFEEKEKQAASNFKQLMDATDVRQIIYLTGIISETEKLSTHLESRFAVEKILNSCKAPLTAVRAGIIVGSGSASFEIIRDIVEKLPIMITPKWLNTKCQPIAIRNVMDYLTGVLLRTACFEKNYDISSGETLTYKEMLLGYAKARKLKRFILTLPIMTPRLSSYWLYFVTATSYPLAVNLVNSMKINVIAKDNNLQQLLNIESIPYIEAVNMAFQKIEQNMVVSSWKDSFASSWHKKSINEYLEVPRYGCLTDKKKKAIPDGKTSEVLDNIWSIGGQRGWYYGNWLWQIRGYMDKVLGGVGLRRGRTNPFKIEVGDSLDFWRVLVADKKNKRLLLYAEMRLPGEAWLEFEVVRENGKDVLKQIATFRPSGILGRLYWYGILPLHYFVFNGMISNIVNFTKK